MRKPILLAAALAALSLSACADNQAPNRDMIVQVRTSPDLPSHCVLQNPRGAWNVYQTPEQIDVSRATGALDVSCSNSQGWSGAVRVTSKVAPLSLAAGIVAGGPVGIGAEAVDGELFIYPETIVVPMSRNIAVVPPAYAHASMPDVEVLEPVRHAPVVASRHAVHRHHVRHAVRCSCGS